MIRGVLQLTWPFSCSLTWQPFCQQAQCSPLLSYAFCLASRRLFKIKVNDLKQYSDLRFDCEGFCMRKEVFIHRTDRIRGGSSVAEPCTFSSWLHRRNPDIPSSVWSKIKWANDPVVESVCLHGGAQDQVGQDSSCCRSSIFATWGWTLLIHELICPYLAFYSKPRRSHKCSRREVQE